MTRRLPPLNALRAFEAAARRGGFAKAAGELAVTPAAVSQQVRLLEAELGVELFRRLPRGLELTPAGRGALPELRAAFAHLARAVEDMRGERLAGPLAVSVLPSLAHRWLLPRLPALAAAHPEIDLPVHTHGRPAGPAPHGRRPGPRRGPRPRGRRPRHPLRQGPLPGPPRPPAADRGGVPGLRAGARARRAAAAAPARRPAGAHAAARAGERGALALLVGLAARGRGRGPRPGARARLHRRGHAGGGGGAREGGGAGPGRAGRGRPARRAAGPSARGRAGGRVRLLRGDARGPRAPPARARVPGLAGGEGRHLPGARGAPARAGGGAHGA